MDGFKGLVCFTNEDNSEVYINPDRIEFITEDKYYGVTFIYLQSGMRIKVKESVSEVIDMLDAYTEKVAEKCIKEMRKARVDYIGNPIGSKPND